jgi:hypothetical protein
MQLVEILLVEILESLLCGMHAIRADVSNRDRVYEGFKGELIALHFVIDAS